MVAHYFKKPFTGWHFFRQIVVLLILTTIVAFIVGTIVFDEPFWDVVRSEGFFTSTFFQVYSLIGSILFLVLQVRRVYSLTQRLNLAVGIVIGIFIISLFFTHFGVGDPYHLYKAFKVVYWVWLLFFPVRMAVPEST